MKKIILFLFASFLLHECAAQSAKAQVYTIVDEMPEYPGGQDSLLRYITRHTRYSPAKDEDIRGSVRVQFVIDKEGRICDIKPAGDRQPNSLEKEVIRAMKAMPKWIPGRHKGEPVAVQYFLPIYICYTQD